MQIKKIVAEIVAAAKRCWWVLAVFGRCIFFSIKFKIIVYSGLLGAGVVQLVRTLPCHNAVHCGYI